jgi:hypothetical protein
MDRIRKIQEAKDQLTTVFVPEKERVEKLRLILEAEQNRKVTYDEAYEVGRELISFYQCLAGNKRITKGGLEELENS